MHERRGVLAVNGNPADLGQRRFSDVSALMPRTPGVYDAEVDLNWAVGGKPNGGYLLAMLGRSAVEVGNHSDVLAASAHYLRAPEPGPVLVEAELLRAGRSASQIRARLTQGNRSCVEALIVTGDLDPDSLPYWEAGLPQFDGPAYEDCERLIPRLPDGTRVALMEQIEVRLDLESSGFIRNAPSGQGELRGWLSLPREEPFDPVSLLFAVDAFPPATFDIEMSGWVPTLELTVYVRALPAPGPVRVLQGAQLIDGQRVDEASFVWDREGRLVAQATQLAAVRLG
jgi:Acyl-CoA thioesterase C-terminal domain/Acyl-CoA thioesterase N-terminal domain